MRRRERGIVGLVVLSLGLGVVTTYGVAWGLLNRFDPWPTLVAATRYDFRVDGGAWRFRVLAGWGTECLSANNRTMWGREGEGAEDRTTGTSPMIIVGPGVPPYWSITGRMSPDDVAKRFEAQTRLGDWVLERAAGWPCRAVVERSYFLVPGGRFVPIPNADVSIRWGGQKPYRPGEDGNRSLPVVPVWGGFLVDAAAFGLVWGLLIVGVRLVGRCVRRARPGCAKCGYDLSGLTGDVCPECGSAVKGM